MNTNPRLIYKNEFYLKKSRRQQYVKRFYTHIASNREESAHLLFQEDNKLMIQRAETFTANVTATTSVYTKVAEIK